MGTALKTLTLRLRGSKTELEEMGEDVTDMATTTSQLQAKLLALTGGQVDIMLDENTFKNSTQILREMAAAWEDRNDIQRASALELMGGKRQANVLSALIQNFDTVEEVIEASANSAGSALKENERWLDSIAGKLDQFNNATQALWQNLLGSDIIKGVVDWGTKIIKSLDTVQGKFLAIVKVIAILMAYKKVNPLDWVKDIGNFFATVKDTGIKQYLASLLGIAPAMKVVTAETVANTIATQTNDVAKTKQLMTEMGLAGATGTLSGAQKEQAATAILNAMSTGKLTMAQGNAMLAMLGYAGATVAADGSLKLLDATTKSFMATNPVGWILAIVSVLMIVIMLVSQIPSKVEKLTEELNNLKTELQDIQTELDSVNSELETTNDRMAELLAKDKLSFTEKEELNNLKKQNDELQRQIDLLELQKKNKSKETADKFVETMNSDLNDSREYFREIDPMAGVENNFWTFTTRAIAGMSMTTESEKVKLNRSLQAYKDYASELEEVEKQIIAVGGEDTKEGKKLAKQKAVIDENMTELKTYMDGKIAEWNTNADKLDYGINEETDEWLDYVRNMEDRWAIEQGGKNAKTNAVNRIFGKNENAEISEAIDGYVKALEKGDVSAKSSIKNIIENNEELVEDIEASGLSIDDAVDSFTSFAADANYKTIEGKVKEMSEASSRLPALLSGAFTKDFIGPLTKEQQEFANLFDANGEVLSDAVAKYFGGEDGGISETTRAEIEKLVKQIHDGKLTVEDALKSFELFSIRSVVDIQIEDVKSNFKDVFVDLEDADGLINTFEELGDAIGSTVGALEAFNQAQADVADKGFVSIQTALKLMEYTDDYGSVLQVVDGKLQLAENAEQNLIQARINSIKVSAQTAVADAQAAYDKAELAVQSYRSAMVEEASASTVATAWQKIVAAAAGVKNALDNIWSGQNIGDLYNSGYNAYLESATGYKTSYDDAGLQALEDALADSKKKLDEAQGNADIANALTPDSLENLYNPSDSKTVDEARDDAFQRDMDYWENRIAANQAKYEQLQNEIDLYEAKGQQADASFYEEQIELEKERKSLLEQQKMEAESRLRAIEFAGDEGSEAWWEVANVLNDIEGELDDVTASMVDLQDAIGEIDTYKFEEFNNRLNDLTSKLETVRNLIAPDGEEDWFSDEGNWTEAGVAVLGSHIQELEMYKQGYEEAMDELAKYQPDYESNESYYEGLGIHSEQEYYDKTEELISQQYDFAESINDTKQSVVDMYESSIDAVEEYVDTLIDGYNDYIDSVKNALDAERD